MHIDQSIIDWLLEGDPAIRWQSLEDLSSAPARQVAAERKLVAQEGWGPRFLALQDPEGTWGGGLYSPKWISTTYTLLTLRRLGLPRDNPQAHKGCQLLLDEGFYHDGGINYFASLNYGETCVTGMVLSLLAYFRYPDERIHSLATYLLGQQMADEGWNCDSYKGDSHSSFHTTISVLEGLHEYAKTEPPNLSQVLQAQARGREFLLQHRLYKSDRTGEVVQARMTRLPFPPRWFYDFLRALDYFQACKAERDERLTDAIQLLEQKRKADGRWVLNAGPSGRTFFQMEKAGKPSRMNTLRALRVLKWWQAA